MYEPINVVSVNYYLFHYGNLASIFIVYGLESKHHFYGSSPLK